MISFISEKNVNSWQKVTGVVSPSHSHIGRFPKQILNVSDAHDLSRTHPDHHLTFCLDTFIYPLKLSLGKLKAIFSLI